MAPEKKKENIDVYLKNADKYFASKGAEGHKKRRKSAPRKGKKTLSEKWDDLTEGPFGTVLYIVLGFLIALAVNEGLKPVLVTDTPVVAVFSESMVPTLEKGDLVVVRGGEEIK